MKRLICTIIGIFLFLVAPPCFTARGQDAEWISPSATFYLSDSELELAKTRALEGDAESALRISEYYGMVKGDYISELPWLEIAAINGNVLAQYNLGQTYLHSHLFKNVRLARFWFKEAEKNGSTEAKMRLEEMKEVRDVVD